MKGHGMVVSGRVSMEVLSFAMVKIYEMFAKRRLEAQFPFDDLLVVINTEYKCVYVPASGFLFTVKIFNGEQSSIVDFIVEDNNLLPIPPELEAMAEKVNATCH